MPQTAKLQQPRESLSFSVTAALEVKMGQPKAGPEVRIKRATILLRRMPGP